MSLTDGLKIRKAIESDLATIVGMLANDRLGRNREISGDEVAQSYKEFFGIIHADTNNDIYVVELADMIVGTFQLNFIPGISFGGNWRAQVESVRVAHSHRRQGIGAAMMEWICNQASERQCHMVQLTSNKQRAEAIEFYKKLGFEATHEGFKKFL